MDRQADKRAEEETDRISYEQVWQDQELRFHLEREARGHFGGRWDWENAVDEAYSWLFRLPPGLSIDSLVETGKRAIHSAVRQEVRCRGERPPEV